MRVAKGRLDRLTGRIPLQLDQAGGERLEVLGCLTDEEAQVFGGFGTHPKRGPGLEAWPIASLVFSEHFFHHREDVLRPEWLDDEVGGSRLDCLHHQRLLSERRAHDDHGVLVLLDDLPGRVDSALEGHHDVHGGEVRSQLLVLFHGFDAVGRLTHYFEPTRGEDVLDHVSHEDRVVNDEDPLRHAEIAPKLAWGTWEQYHSPRVAS